MPERCGWKCFIAVVLTVVVLWPWGQAAAQNGKVAVVNGKELSYAYFMRQMKIVQHRELQGAPGPMPEPVMRQLRTKVVERMVAEELLYQESLEKGYKIEPQMVDADLIKLKRRFGSAEQYRKRLELMHLTEEQLKGQIAREFLIRKLVASEIGAKVDLSEADSRKYYASHAGEFRSPERVRARHILIKVAKEDSAKSKVAARQKLENIKQRIMAGEEFSQLAKKHSQGPSSKRGGDLGYFARGSMVKSFEEVAFRLAPNEVSEIVETQFGYHLIKVLDHREAGVPGFDEVKKEIANRLRQQRIQKLLESYVAKLKKRSKIEIFLK